MNMELLKQEGGYLPIAKSRFDVDEVHGEEAVNHFCTNVTIDVRGVVLVAGYEGRTSLYQGTNHLMVFAVKRAWMNLLGEETRFIAL